MSLPTNRVIFTGRLRAGKDHVAQILGLKPLGFAEPLYAACSALLGSCDKSLPAHRRLLQLLGAWGRGTSLEGEYELGLPLQKDVAELFQKHPEKILDEAHLKLPVDWTLFGRRADFWIIVAQAKAKTILRENPEVRIAIPNGRFPNEVEAFQKIGFLHLHVTCSEETRRSRPGGNVSAEAENDVTEAYAKELDYSLLGPTVIWNDPGKPVPDGKGYLPVTALE